MSQILKNNNNNNTQMFIIIINKNKQYNLQLLCYNLIKNIFFISSFGVRNDQQLL